MIKYNEAQSVRKTYEQIVKRLEEERLTFDNQLSAFERSLKAKKQDANDLEMMSRDANHAKEVARVSSQLVGVPTHAAIFRRILTHNIHNLNRPS